MNLDKLYDLAESENIKIYDYCVEEDIYGIYLNYDKLNAIALNYNNIKNSQQEKCVLCEELGHYYCNALYYLDSDNVQKKKCEYRAMKWAYSVLVPLQKLKEKLTQGFNLYELADYFNVDCKYMIECINFYVEKYGVLV